MNTKKNVKKNTNKKNVRSHHAQVALEFMFLITLGVIILIVLMAVIGAISDTKADEKTYFELDDLGSIIQQELVVASDLEDGYTRVINIPTTVNGRNFNITTGSAGQYSGYLNIDYEKTTIYYSIPVINGSLQKGYNQIKKNNGTLTVTQ